MIRKLVSVIAPVFNEKAVIEEFVKRTASAIGPLEERYSFEIILVDDGSSDGSLEAMKRILSYEKRLRVIELRRNYGQTAALQAGMDAARGEIFITLDADLQHFPEEIPRFLKKIEEGHEMVCGWRKNRAEGILRRWPSKAANYILRRITRLDIHDFGTTFRAYKADVMKELRLYGEFHRFIPALVANMGFKISEIPIENIVRPAGKANYGLGRTLVVFLDMILLYFMIYFLDRPMRMFGKLGFYIGVAGAGIILVLVVYAYIYSFHAVQEHSGWYMIAIMLILASIQLFLTGIVAEIVTRIHYEQKDRRVYHIRRELTPGDDG